MGYYRLVPDTGCYQRKKYAGNATNNTLSSMKRNRLYILLSSVIIIGYIWLGFSYNNVILKNNGVNVCLFKQVTNMPCPSCGSTRAVFSILSGDISESLLLNPFGMIIISIMVLSPFLILYDVLKGKQYVYSLYHRIELVLKRKLVAIPMIFLVLINWIWNIYKES